MKQLFINIVGHNASGKTTIAKRLEEKFKMSRVNGDDFRHFIDKHIRFFGELDISTPTDRGALLRPLTTNYRLQLTRILLEAGENVIFDGSGFYKRDREPLHKLLVDFPQITRIIIRTEVPEPELLERLETRKANWLQMYHDIRKPGYEPPTEAETDMLLVYNQHNYDEIEQKIADLLKN